MCCWQALVHALPELLPIIQTHLLDLLSLGLTRKPYRDNLPTATAHSLAQAIQLGRLSENTHRGFIPCTLLGLAVSVCRSHKEPFRALLGTIMILMLLLMLLSTLLLMLLLTAALEL